MPRKLNKRKLTVVIVTLYDDGVDCPQPYIFPGHLSNAEALTALRAEWLAEQDPADAEPFPEDYEDIYAVSISTMTVAL